LSSIIKTGRVHIESTLIDSVEDFGFSVAGEEFLIPGVCSGPTVDELLEQAEEESRCIVDKAHLEAVRIKEIANERGFEEGREVGLADGLAEAREQVEILTQMVDELQSIRQQIIANSEQAVVVLALAVAEKILRCQVGIDKEVVTRVVEAATKNLLAQDIVRISVSPEDLEKVSNYWSEEHDPNFRDHGLEINGDKRIQRGGCVVTTRRGTIDAQMDVQLSEIERSFSAAVDAG
jgi:flagellar assembly protein FliH